MKRKKGYFLFGDLIEQYYSILAQILEHQERVAGQNGKKIKIQVRKHLEGWDLFDLATGGDPRPRVATLQALGYGWVDFIRSIEAVTLLGRGFGNEWAKPPETVHGLVWHCPGDVVEHCQSQSHGFSGRLRKVFKQHHDPVQVLYPRNWHQYLRLGRPDRLADAGAIVFGHCRMEVPLEKG